VPTSVALGAVEGITMLNLNPYKLFIIVSAPRTMVVYPLGSLNRTSKQGLQIPETYNEIGVTVVGGESSEYLELVGLRIIVYESWFTPAEVNLSAIRPLPRTLKMAMDCCSALKCDIWRRGWDFERRVVDFTTENL